MPQYIKSGDSYRVAYITGPKHVLLGLIFKESGKNEVNIVNLGEAEGDCNHGTLSLEAIKESILEGVAKANTSFGTNYTVKQIEYVENDTPDYAIYPLCAYLIVKGLNQGIEFKVVNALNT